MTIGPNCGDNNPINLATSSDLLIPKNSITLEAKNKPEWAHLRFIVFKLDDNWDVYHSVSDNLFSFRLRNLVKKYVMDLEIQSFLKGELPDEKEAILNKFREDLLRLISNTKKSDINFPTNTSYDQLEKDLKKATVPQLFSALKYCFLDTKNKTIDYLIHPDRYFIFFETLRGNENLTNEAIKTKYRFLPNLSIEPSAYFRDYEPTPYVAIAFDQKEKLPVMSVNIYPLSKDGITYQENRFISRNHSYGLIKALRSEKVTPNLSLVLHAASLKAMENDFFIVSPLPAMSSIFYENGYVKPSTYGGASQTNEKFKDFSEEIFNSVKPMTQLEIFKKHVDLRFEVLRRILGKDIKFIARFPGASADEHYLGAGITQRAWGQADGPKITEYITQKIKELATSFSEQVSFGFIGDYAYNNRTKGCNRSMAQTHGNPPGWDLVKQKFTIHIWGAGQATCFSTQRPGVFGISTMPSSDQDKLFAPDLIESEYNIPSL